jgi:hypothetical protein
METSPSDLNSPKSQQESKSVLIMRFTAGAIIGLLVAAIYWGTSIYFAYPISLNIGIIGCLFLALACGLMTLKWGYKTLENILENLR